MENEQNEQNEMSQSTYTNSFWYVEGFQSSLPNISFPVRKRVIDMGQIKTVGKDNLDSTFSGNTHSLYEIIRKYSYRLSSLGVKVLDSEEVEQNLLSQANELSIKQTPEYKNRIPLYFT